MSDSSDSLDIPFLFNTIREIRGGKYLAKLILHPPFLGIYGVASPTGEDTHLYESKITRQSFFNSLKALREVCLTDFVVFAELSFYSKIKESQHLPIYNYVLLDIDVYAAFLATIEPDSVLFNEVYEEPLRKFNITKVDLATLLDENMHFWTCTIKPSSPLLAYIKRKNHNLLYTDKFLEDSISTFNSSIKILEVDEVIDSFNTLTISSLPI
jgi:hypothetical protein